MCNIKRGDKSELSFTITHRHLNDKKNITKALWQYQGTSDVPCINIHAKKILRTGRIEAPSLGNLEHVCE